MSVKHMRVFAVCVALLALGTLAAAQQVVTPDAGVHGSGVVLLGSNTNYAEFNINVTQVGPAFTGGFSWVEYTSSATATMVKPAVIVSRQIVGMKFLAGNHVVVEANGYYAGRLAKITFEALDDLNMDWVKIRAETLALGTEMPTLIYEKSGGVAKGSLVVFRKAVENWFAAGNGAIAVKSNQGVFSFKVSSSLAGPVGSISYREFNPLLMGPIVRPVVEIRVSKITGFKVDGRRAYIEGLGVLNGLPAKVRVVADDLVKPGPVIQGSIVPVVRDFFSIEATPTVPTFAPANYAASGPVIRGDVTIGKVGLTPVLL